MTGGLSIDWVAQDRESIPQPPSEYLAACGRRGGNTTLAQRGKEHYANMGRKARANQAKRKQQHEQTD